MGQTSNSSPARRASAKQAAVKKGPGLLAGMIIVGLTMVVVAVVGLLLANGSRESAAGQVSGPLRAGMRLEDFALASLEGETVRLSDFAGRPVLINTWATWCPPCKREMPDLEAFYQQHKARGFVVLAINAGEQREQAADFAEQIGLTFPVLLDPNESFTSRYGIRDFPTSILVGADGAVKYVHVGLITPEQLEQKIRPFIP